MVMTRVLQATNTLIEIDGMQGRGAQVFTVLETALPDGTDAEKEKVAIALAALLQLEIETWIHIDDLPVDEETIGWNANTMQAAFGDAMRWERQGPNRWLVSRADIIEVTWDGTSYRVRVRNAR